MSTEEMRGGKEEMRVKILTIEGCDYCTWLKSELDAEHIPYIDINANKEYKLADKMEMTYKTDRYPMVIVPYKGTNIIILSETSLATSDTLRTFDTIPHLVGIIKQYKNEI